MRAQINQNAFVMMDINLLNHNASNYVLSVAREHLMVFVLAIMDTS